MQEIIIGTLSKTASIFGGLGWILVYGILTTFWVIGLLVLPFLPLKCYDEKRIAQKRNFTWIEVVVAIIWIITYWSVYVSLTLTIIEKIAAMK